VARYGEDVLYRYFRATTAAAQSVRRDTPVFHNSGHISVARARRSVQHPPRARVAADRRLGLRPFPTLRALRHHQKWIPGHDGQVPQHVGEFGGFKRPAALRHECGAMLASGAKCSVGDQLHPNGEMNLDTYRLIARPTPRWSARSRGATT